MFQKKSYGYKGSQLLPTHSMHIHHQNATATPKSLLPNWWARSCGSRLHPQQGAGPPTCSDHHCTAKEHAKQDEPTNLNNQSSHSRKRHWSQLILPRARSVSRPLRSAKHLLRAHIHKSPDSLRLPRFRTTEHDLHARSHASGVHICQAKSTFPTIPHACYAKRLSHTHRLNNFNTIRHAGEAKRPHRTSG